ncbi:MAG: hypothetical protein IV100_08760 [Myxococcales bacterium]|nr:hypothetical protein [Myxococcales bacterium]
MTSVFEKIDTVARYRKALNDIARFLQEFIATHTPEQIELKVSFFFFFFFFFLCSIDSE